MYTMVGEEAGIMEYVHLRGVEIIHQIQHTFKVNKYLLYQERIYVLVVHIDIWQFSSFAIYFIGIHLKTLNFFWYLTVWYVHMYM